LRIGMRGSGAAHADQACTGRNKLAAGGS